MKTLIFLLLLITSIEAGVDFSGKDNAMVAKIETIRIQLQGILLKHSLDGLVEDKGTEGIITAIALHEDLMNNVITFDVYKEKFIPIIRLLAEDNTKFKDMAKYILELLSGVGSTVYGGMIPL